MRVLKLSVLLLSMMLLFQTLQINLAEQFMTPFLMKKVVVVKVETENSGWRGSGSIISAKGHVLTAAHLFQHQEKITKIIVEGYDDRVSKCSLIRQNDVDDLAIIECRWLAGMDYVHSSGNLSIGQPVIVIGAPGPLPLIAAFGRVAGRLSDAHKVLLDVLIGPGMSGGPVFDLYGRQVGVVQAIYMNPPFTAITANVDVINNTIRSVRELR